MNFIHQEREEVIKLNNIAQTQIVDILKNIDSVNTIDLNVNMPLSGDLDLSVLEDYKQLRNIMFTEGRITSIRNIPEKIQKIEISKNLLIDLENLPKGLLHLDINDNYLKFLDLSYLEQLEVLYCENNKLTEVKLPKSIIEESDALISIFMPNIELPDKKTQKGVRSLNLSVACGIAIYEAHKQINSQINN